MVRVGEFIKNFFGGKPDTALDWHYQGQLFNPDGSVRQDFLIYAKTKIGVFEIYESIGEEMPFGVSYPRITQEKFEIFATEKEAKQSAQFVYDKHIKKSRAK